MGPGGKAADIPWYHGKTGYLVFTTVFLLFIFIMDVQLYNALQRTTLVNQTVTDQSHYSPFKPLSMKLVMSDPTVHYILTPSAEYFNEYSHFSDKFPAITPNLISFTHLGVGLLSGKFVASECLATRRYGVLLFILRTWMDTFDGVVYRSRTSSKLYTSNRKTLGYYVDMYCDTLGSAALCFGVLFYFFKCKPSNSAGSIGGGSNVSNDSTIKKIKGGDQYTLLPLTNATTDVVEDSDLDSVCPASGKRSAAFWNPFDIVENTRQGYSRQYLFVKCFCLGLLIGVAAATWDKMVSKYDGVFTMAFKEQSLQTIQTEELHSGTTWLVIYMWRICEGQAILMMLLIAIFIDKAWEFVCYFPYIGYAILIVLNIASEIHIREVSGKLGLHGQEDS